MSYHDNHNNILYKMNVKNAFLVAFTWILVF